MQCAICNVSMISLQVDKKMSHDLVIVAVAEWQINDGRERSILIKDEFTYAVRSLN